MIYKYYGPPGTGKTYKLISRAKAYVRKYKIPLHRIGYFAFTKKAAEEAKQRMPFENKKLRYFKTLHALAFECIKVDDLNISQEDIMQPYHYEEFGKKLNLQVKFYDRYNKDESFYLGFENPYFQIISRAVNKCTSIRKEFDLEEHDPRNVNWKQLDHIYNNLLEYKSKKKLLDILKTKTKDIYLAGDDDQAIFAWAGADVKRFIEEPAKEKTLIYSKRISKSIQLQSTVPINNIVGARKLKKYYPRDYQGKCEEIYNLDEIDLTKGKWLIITRTVSKLLKIQDMLIEKGLYFESNRGKSVKVTMFNAMNSYNEWRKGKELTEEELKNIKNFTGDVKLNKNKTWFDAFKLEEDVSKEYLLRLLENKENLKEPARIWLSTIHAIKGGEQDNVILCLDMGKKIIEAIKQSQDKADEEHRVWYVGTTRARNNLYKIKLNTSRRGYQL